MENSALIPDTMYTKSDALKDARDLTKNLVGGDYERQYKEEKNGKGRRRCVLFGVSIGVLAVWLVALTLVREIQVRRLRSEVDQLTANVIALSANVMSLNQKLSNNRLFNEFKNLEDTIYADEDQDGNLVEDITVATDKNVEIKDSDKEKGNYSPLNKLHGLTVLEDDAQMADDEDMYDGDEDAESGDWYPDYYKQGPKIGTTNMVRLKPEDFTDAVLPADKERQIPIPNITEIKRLLNENPELTDIDLPTMKIPTKAAAEEVRVKRSVFPDAAADAIAEMPVPKIISKSDDRRKMKKFISSTDSSIAEKMSLHTVTRTARNSEDGDGRRRPFIAAHFHGNTSHLSPEIHEHYKGNGLVSVAHDAPHDVWYPSPWTLASPHPRPTLTRAGHVHVHHTGVYLVYVQIYYLDSHDVISWVLHRTNPEIEGRETLLQCAQSAHSPEPLEKPNSCFSAAALFLRAGDKLAVRNTGGNRHSLMQPEKSFIGLIKLADAEEPNQEL
ncbi:uncharacterized protein LOC106719040 [Papilio machaon]|uniref:uncharacterized protein LOC106719040 n=1 Tax=Papilio machaon TaxID=76193 RepID=UPI001E664961|nr:uncharacterized protein LOC106719040 [Papilio machaon]